MLKIVNFFLQLYIFKLNFKGCLTLYNVCAVSWGMLSTVGVFSTMGDIMSTVGDIVSTVGVFSTVRDIMINVGDILSTVRGVQ